MNECQRVIYFGITALYCMVGSLTASESEWNGRNKMGATDYKNFYMLVWYDGNPKG